MVHEIQKVSRNDLMSLSSLKLSEMVKIPLLKEMADERLPGSPTRRLLQLCPWGAVPFLQSCLQILSRIAPFSLLETKSSFPSFCAANLPFLLPQMPRLFQPLFVMTVPERNFLVSLLPLPRSKWDICYSWHLPFTSIRSNFQLQNISGPPKS